MTHLLRVWLAGLSLIFLLNPDCRTWGTPINKPLVIFFGGFESTPQQMQKWIEAISNSPIAQTFSFQAIAYPAGAPSDGSLAASGMSAGIDDLVRIILGSTDRKYILACHSSGCGIANVLTENLLNQVPHPKNVMMVNLDGGLEGDACHLRGYSQVYPQPVGPSPALKEP
jgi:hypothetical protein